MPPAPSPKSAAGAKLLNAQSVFGFDLGAVSCFCVHSGKEGSESINACKQAVGAGKGKSCESRSPAPAAPVTSRRPPCTPSPPRSPKPPSGIPQKAEAAPAKDVEPAAERGEGFRVESVPEEPPSTQEIQTPHLLPVATACFDGASSWAGEVASSLMHLSLWLCSRLGGCGRSEEEARPS
eukprot:TRINITY_DN32746_c0_g1_i1.p1 TRINITY_DN32746_c0_g1~~TRINITY_DN32746_c0_g1_i1.p1  ORF type:complete len:180 (+),score=32.14 TRINITY_DN32746_c0_g1_i1:99-638(+)